MTWRTTRETSAVLLQRCIRRQCLTRYRSRRYARSSRMSTNGNQRRTLIAIDPGYSTGVAVFVNERLIEVFTSTTPHSRLRNVLRPDDHGSLEVACEVAPPDRIDWAQSEVEELVRRLESRTHWYRPSDWKPHPASRTHPRDGNRHERDAVGMGRYHIATHL